MAVTIYHNPRCTKSRQTLALLTEKGVQPEVIEYLKTPPSVDELTHILSLLGMEPAQLLRKKEAREEGVDPALPAADLIAQMVAHPKVIERPIVVANGKARVGRPPESVLEIL